MSAFQVHRAVAGVFDALTDANRHLQTLSPWLATASPDEVHRALFFASETLRIAGIVLQPIMPTKSTDLLNALGVQAGRRAWADAKVGGGGERVMSPAKGVLLFPPVDSEDSQA